MNASAQEFEQLDKQLQNVIEKTVARVLYRNRKFEISF